MRLIADWFSVRRLILLDLKTLILQGVDGSVDCLQGWMIELSELLSLQVWIRSCERGKRDKTYKGCKILMQKLYTQYKPSYIYGTDRTVLLLFEKKLSFVVSLLVADFPKTFKLLSHSPSECITVSTKKLTRI